MAPVTSPERRHRRRLLIAVTAGALALLLLTGVGVYGLLRGPGDPDHPASESATTSSPSDSPAPSSSSGVPTLEPIPVTARPEAFARAVAEALFTWDTTSGLGPADYAQVLADAAASMEADALAADVRGYLPTTQAWGRLRPYATRQWLTIDHVTIPETWETAVGQAAPGQIPDGTIAYTVEGTRHRAGIQGTTPVETSRPVSFTVFLTCTPTTTDRGVTGSRCELLRLSQLDAPLH